MRDAIGSSYRTRLRVCARTDLADGLAVRHVVRDDLAELGEVPAVPLAAAHDVVIQLLVQVIQESYKHKEKPVQ